jgi:transposase-like protein
MSDLKEACGLIVYSHGVVCPNCGEFNELEESGCERNGSYNEVCDSCEKEYLVKF